MSSSSLSATAGIGRQSKVPKVGGGAETYPQPFVSDPKPEDPDQMGIGGSQGRDRSVYLAACRRDWFASKPYYPLYKVNVASDSDESSPWGAPAAGKTRVAKLRTYVGGKTFVSLQSRWIVGVGGYSGGIIIYDTNMDRVIRGPELVAAKVCPVVAAVGYRVYALCSRPSFVEDPNFVPWFEVLDLKDALITEAADGSLSLDGCSWKPLPSPLCFPGKLTPMDYIMPSIITVRSYVVVGRYILVSLNPPSSGTYAFDTEEHEWHKVDKEHLPFVGSATPHRNSGCIFLALSRENGPVRTYRICVSASSSPSSVSTEARLSHKGGALNLSITVFSVRSKEHEEVDAMSGHYLTSLDSKRFSTLTFELDNRKRSRTFDDTIGDFRPRKLFAKLMTYQIENPEILNEEKLRAVMPEVSISSQSEQIFKISSDIGFSSPTITFALSI
ncbi:unnamed protein product [Miscanthus lutarioriparius]|uniref:Uncharacterized protein n=1 Tax=Miscanthus lutarioriparius TaxID=422564 RepID=A0A811MKA2_9POAL|nr:unnamed protein product [Miscanthus lutarioriparius]